MRWAAILIAPLLVGCNSSSFYIEDEFTAREVQLIHDAIDEWIEATDSDHAVIFTRTGYSSGRAFSYWKDWKGGPDYPVFHKIWTTDPGYTTLKVEVGVGEYSGAATQGWRAAIVADKQSDESDFYQTALHEVGHFLMGPEHLSGGIMHPKGKGFCIDQEALSHFCDKYSCGPNRHNTCEDW